MTEGTSEAASQAALGASVSNRRVAVAQAGFASALAILVFAPILYYMFLHWNAVDDYSHGNLVVPLAVFFAWERRRDLRRAPIEPSWWGLLPLALGALALVVGRLGVELMAMRVAFVLTLIGIVILLALFGETPDQVILGMPVTVWGPAFVILFLGGIGFSLYNWRCPACHKYLGKAISPKFCAKCGTALS